MIPRKYLALSATFLAFCCLATPVAAKTLNMFLPVMLNEHERIRAAEEQRNVAMHMLRAADAGWYPKINLSANAGHEKIRPPDAVDTDELRSDTIIRGTQLLTDFGRQDSIVGRARQTLEHAKFSLESIRQQVLLEGVTAFMNIVRAREKLKYARESEENISKQTGMEEALVEKGAGLSSDVLQTKSQLAGARALLVSVEGELVLAGNRFLTVFKKSPSPDEIQQFQLPDKIFDDVPVSLDQAIAIAKDKNPQIRMSELNVQIAKQDLQLRKAQYFPTLSLFAEGERRERDGGAMGIREEMSVGVEFSHNLFNGGADRAGIKAAVAQVIQVENSLLETTHLVEEQTRNAWQNLKTSGKNHKLLNNQANIMGEFLELARKERKLGNRSLLDVLTGEVNYINSVSMSVSAQIDTIIAAYSLHHAMGNLNMDLFKQYTKHQSQLSSRGTARHVAALTADDLNTKHPRLLFSRGTAKHVAALTADDLRQPEKAAVHIEPIPAPDNINGMQTPEIIDPRICPEASTRHLTLSDLVYKSSYQRRMIINEIYASHSYIFESEEMNNYFNLQAWYTPLYRDVQDLLNPIEIRNIDFVKQFKPADLAPGKGELAAKFIVERVLRF